MKNKIAVITMVKNEADIIESFVRHALSYADILLVTDHKSTDETRQILNLLQAEGLAIKINTYEDEGHSQSEVMTQLLYQAIEGEHADIVIAADSDEFLILNDSHSNENTLRTALQNLDSTKIYYLPWITYELQYSEEDQDIFILSRPCQRNATPDILHKIIIGAGTAKFSQIIITQGNHRALLKPLYNQHTKQTSYKAEVFSHDFHVAHFPQRSRNQYLSKVLCGWITNVARFSEYTFYAAHWQEAFQKYLSTGDISADPLSNPIETDLSSYSGNITPSFVIDKENKPLLRYTKKQYNGWKNILQLAENIAAASCRKKILSQKQIVSVLMVYDGNDNKLMSSLEGILTQSYPYLEILLLNFSNALDDELRALIKTRYDFQAFKIIHSPIFRNLNNNVHGNYIQWIMPGDILAPDKIQAMLEAAVLTPSHPLVLSQAVEPDNVGFRPAFINISAPQKSIGLFDNGLQKYLLHNGWILTCGLSGALFRREIMEETDWLENYFIGSNPMELTIWTEALKNVQEVLYILKPMVTVSHCWTADDFILHEMEWIYLLNHFKGTSFLSDSEYSAARKCFSEERKKMANTLRAFASADLYDAYLIAQ